MGNAFCFSLREWNHAARIHAELVLMKRHRAARRDVPSEISSERGVAQDDGNATDFIAVSVDFRHEHLDHLLDPRRSSAHDARAIVWIETRAPVVIEHRIDEAWLWRSRSYARYRREAHRGFVRRDELARGEGWIPARRGRNILHHPVAKMHGQRVDDFTVRHRIRG